MGCGSGPLPAILRHTGRGRKGSTFSATYAGSVEIDRAIHGAGDRHNTFFKDLGLARLP